ncbi:glycosyltransferase [Conexibacter sp. W3-3-2]|uniref:glycosyltransferase n=1 Tax=Conexibacter sp. W3-3-2 TaxID=2675227 RepID=UPI0012B797F2|nr:glycosyltransferase [Conexibacter sp. W3-3-2]MTD45423.1 glycosyltransferase [Conexibacter sp. W3-3-2]
MPEAAAGTLAGHAATIDGIARAARACADAGRLETASALVQSAAGIAALRHPGRFAHPVLDDVLARASASLPDVAWVGGRGVLHVLSNALEVGGHTRLAWRWMELDGDRPQSFVVTRPVPGPTPPSLAAAAARSGGREWRVPGAQAGLLATASALRELAASFDLVVLHAQPNDPLPSLAFAAVTDRAPVLLCNHADHCFWLGRDVADVVVGHREVAATLARTRRGVPAGRTATLPLPLDDVPATDPDARTAARARLGIPAAARVLLTVGSAYKFEAPAGGHLLDVLLPVLAADPAAVLLAVGPAPEGRWAAAAAQTAGRVLATGVLPDVADLLAAADVYVESYPCSSGTAALEAAQTGLPVVAWAPDAAQAALLGSAGAAAGLWPSARTAAELARLLAAPAPARDAVLAHHAPARWRATLADAITAPREGGPVRAAQLADPPVADAPEDRLLLDLHVGTGHCHAPEVVTRWAAQAAALAAVPAVERCFVPGLLGPTTHLELARCFTDAVVAPGPGEEATAVDRLRAILRGGLAQRGVVALPPDRVEAAFPALEAALAAGEEVDLDVVPTADPGSLLHAGALAVPAAA